MAAEPSDPARQLYPLARAFAREERALLAAGVDSWEQLADLTDPELRRLSQSGGALERQLRKLRGQARLVVDLDLQAADAALLLYAGIASRQALAQASPQQLITQIGRLERSLLGMAPPRIERSTLLQWIRRAQTGPGRSWN